MRSTFFMLTALMFFSAVSAQQSFYDINSIQEIRIYFSDPDWDYKMDTAKAGMEDYIMADRVVMNGTTYDSVGVKYKGNSSYNSSYDKNPLHIELDTYKNQSYGGIQDIKLSNNYADPSMIREVLAYDLLSNYMDCPRSNFAKVFINDNYIGLYSNDESINKDFCSKHFYSSSNILVKCNPLVTPGPTTKSSLRYITPDSTGYLNFYEVKSTDRWSELINLFDTVTNRPNDLEEIMDLDRAIWMLAFNNVMVNLDSYTGVFCQNYYLYKDNNGRFNPIIWDLNMSFGGFPFAGSGNTSMGSMTNTQLEQLPYNLHSADQYWPLIKAILNNPSWKKMYIAHMRTMLNEQIASGNYLQKANALQSLISTDVIADTNKFFTDADFQNSLSQQIQNGSYFIPGISTLMSARNTFLQATNEFTAVPPQITNVLASPTVPALNSAVTITANINDPSTSYIYLGYRLDPSSRFTKTPMYDDGLHNDGAAADGVFGASFNLNTYRAQYYIYAENAQAGIFSPEAAEHRFHEVTANVQTAAPGQLVINEFLPINQTDTVNEFNDHEDWIELYNKTGDPVSLNGIFLSDNADNIQKYAFPTNTIVMPYDYLVIWADENSSSSTPNNLHCNFKLSGSGETIILSDLTGQILDSVIYGSAIADVSIGRCPNGTGNFASQTTTTFHAENCPVGIEDVSNASFTVYPNPFSDIITIRLEDQHEHTMRIFSADGRKVMEENILVEKTLNMSTLTPGLYELRIGNSGKKLIRL